EGGARSIAEISPDVPPALVTIVERAMAKEPAARFRSAEELRVALLPFAKPLPVPSRAIVRSEAVTVPVPDEASAPGAADLLDLRDDAHEAPAPAPPR